MQTIWTQISLLAAGTALRQLAALSLTETPRHMGQMGESWNFF